MRNIITVASLGLSILGACSSEPGAPKDPPVLRVTSPTRAYLTNHPGAVQVKGTVTPNATSQAPITQVMVNNIPATVGADGNFVAVIDASQGFTQIHTVASDAAGSTSDDTRSMLAGELQKPGANIAKAITAAISADAFAKISSAAASTIKNMDVGAMVKPMNPVQHAGDANGPDCLYDRVYLDDLKFSNVKISLIPASGALDFSVEIDGLDVPGHAAYAVSCLDGTESWRVTANRVVVSGQLNITPNGMQGFDTKLTNPNVQITGLNIDASGIPGTIIDMMHLNSTIEWVVEKGAEAAMGPIMNQALGGLAGPKQLDVMGKTIDMQVVPADIVFDPTGGLVTLDTSMLIEGSEGSQGFVFTDNGMPNMDPGNGFQLGLADDLMNEMMSQFNAIGMLNLSQASDGGTFDTTAMAMSLPPTISADPADGSMKVMLGDMTATFTNHGAAVAKAAINASMTLKIVPAANGYGVAVQLGKPDIHVDVLDDVANDTRLTNADLERSVSVTLASQIDSISKLLTSIPLPQVAGLQMKNLSIGSDEGYVMVKGSFE